MANKMVNLRLGPKLLKEIDSIVSRASYENRSEFIRETLRKEVEGRKKERLIRELRAGLGEGKRLGLKDQSPEEFEKIREEVGKKAMERYGLK
jgi:Arc/MetJ-type ribon-helix-helix transcriptional regulator